MHGKGMGGGDPAMAGNGTMPADGAEGAMPADGTMAGDGATGAMAGDGTMAGAASAVLRLSELEVHARNHAIVITVGFLILLPIGVLVARYTRTIPYKWFYAHWIIQLVISAPVIVAGWVLGYNTTSELEVAHFKDPHQKMGLVLLILYIIQMLIGAVVHFFKFPTLLRGRRAPHNYIHVALGLAIFVLAQWQVHYGLFTEWTFATGGAHQVPMSAKNAWLALLIVFWVLYFLGMALIPRQFRQESRMRNGRFGRQVRA